MGPNNGWGIPPGGFGPGGPGAPYQPFRPQPPRPAPQPQSLPSGVGLPAWDMSGPTGAPGPYNPFVNPNYDPMMRAQTQNMMSQWMQSAMQPRTAGERYGDMANSIFNSLIAPGLAENSAPGAAEGIAKGMEKSLELEQQRREQYDQRQANYVRGLGTFMDVLENTAPVKREQYQNWLDTRKAEQDFQKMQSDMALAKLQQEAARTNLDQSKEKFGWEKNKQPYVERDLKRDEEREITYDARDTEKWKWEQEEQKRKPQDWIDKKSQQAFDNDIKERELAIRAEEMASLLKQEKDTKAAEQARAKFKDGLKSINPEIITQGHDQEIEAKIEAAINAGHSEDDARRFALAWAEQKYSKNSSGKKVMKNKKKQAS